MTYCILENAAIQNLDTLNDGKKTYTKEKAYEKILYKLMAVGINTSSTGELTRRTIDKHLLKLWIGFIQLVPEEIFKDIIDLMAGNKNNLKDTTGASAIENTKIKLKDYIQDYRNMMTTLYEANTKTSRDILDQIYTNLKLATEKSHKLQSSFIEQLIEQILISKKIPIPNIDNLFDRHLKDTDAKLNDVKKHKDIIKYMNNKLDYLDKNVTVGKLLGLDNIEAIDSLRVALMVYKNLRETQLITPLTPTEKSILSLENYIKETKTDEYKSDNVSNKVSKLKNIAKEKIKLISKYYIIPWFTDVQKIKFLKKYSKSIYVINGSKMTKFKDSKPLLLDTILEESDLCTEEIEKEQEDIPIQSQSTVNPINRRDIDIDSTINQDSTFNQDKTDKKWVILVIILLILLCLILMPKIVSYLSSLSVPVPELGL
ncbi:hypothetical protein NEOKW01_0967 [Nematocida sp. AWRm80]|nr:hypothetical protein NEOKW01_0967 [Nematocida sp. AWRm80]